MFDYYVKQIAPFAIAQYWAGTDETQYRLSIVRLLGLNIYLRHPYSVAQDSQYSTGLFFVKLQPHRKNSDILNFNYFSCFVTA